MSEPPRTMAQLREEMGEEWSNELDRKIELCRQGLEKLKAIENAFIGAARADLGVDEIKRRESWLRRVITRSFGRKRR